MSHSLFSTIKALLLSLWLVCVWPYAALAEGTILSPAALNFETPLIAPLATQDAWIAKVDDSKHLAALDFDARADYSWNLFNPRNGEDSQRLWQQTTLTVLLGPAVAGVIALLPEDISQWDKSDAGNLGEKWKDNVTSGPVWDNDVWYINYIGHPYFGGVYYQVARNSGYSQWDSFTYTFLMSTFYWEYGLEAFAETPSIQDLIVTPVGGWIYGEWAHHKQKQIEANGRLVWGSEFWGSTALFFLDRIDNIGKGLNRLFGANFIRTGSITLAPQPLNMRPVRAGEFDGYWGVNIQLYTR